MASSFCPQLGFFQLSFQQTLPLTQGLDRPPHQGLALWERGRAHHYTKIPATVLCLHNGKPLCACVCKEESERLSLFCLLLQPDILNTSLVLVWLRLPSQHRTKHGTACEPGTTSSLLEPVQSIHMHVALFCILSLC